MVGHKIDPFNEILVTAGAYEALYATIQGLVNPNQLIALQNVFNLDDKLSNFYFYFFNQTGMLMMVMKSLSLNRTLIAMNQW